MLALKNTALKFSVYKCQVLMGLKVHRNHSVCYKQKELLVFFPLLRVGWHDATA